MHTNGIVERHWLYVSLHFGIDVVLFGASYLLATHLRFGARWDDAVGVYWPSITCGALLFAVAAYICGLYAVDDRREQAVRPTLALVACYVVAVTALTLLFYIKFSTRIGRGVMIMGSIGSMLCIWLHHWWLNRHRRHGRRERILLVVESREDEQEFNLLTHLASSRFEVMGVVTHRDYQMTGPADVLGTAEDLPHLVQLGLIDRVICTGRIIQDTTLCATFCRLRYAGVSVMPLISLCEEVHHCVPLELITPEWLMNASASPHIFYLKKLKRAFDVVVSLLGLVSLGPLLGLGMLAVWLTSPGPVLFRQTRVGRFGRHFQVLKLRTMGTDAEKDGPQWSSRNDPRVTPVGAWLRKYRVDEIPQLINILRGEMSWVGPRPERPEFVQELARQIPFYNERLMVQPGLTGWAQVNYPYGATLDDARRKLEYDLYYAKQMSLFLDVFSLLDTIRIVLMGGAHSPRLEQLHTSRRALLRTLHPASHPVVEASPVAEVFA